MTVLNVVLALGGVALAWLVALPRIFRRHRDMLIRLGPFKAFLTRYNAMTRNISGTERSAWGLVTHEGRRSGRTYQTSLGTHPFGDGFLLPLGYGPHTDWYQNIMAAGGMLTCLERAHLPARAARAPVWARGGAGVAAARANPVATGRNARLRVAAPKQGRDHGVATGRGASGATRRTVTMRRYPRHA